MPAAFESLPLEMPAVLKVSVVPHTGNKETAQHFPEDRNKRGLLSLRKEMAKSRFYIKRAEEIMPQKSIGIAIQQELEPLRLWASLKVRNLHVFS